MADETTPDPVLEEPQEEFFDNQPTDVEVEETEATPEEGLATKPWDPSKIRISTKPFSLRQIIDMIEDKDIDLAPDFQRLYVWKPRQRSRLIESVLLKGGRAVFVEDGKLADHQRVALILRY